MYPEDLLVALTKKNLAEPAEISFIERIKGSVHNSGAFGDSQAQTSLKENPLLMPALTQRCRAVAIR